MSGIRKKLPAIFCTVPLELLRFFGGITMSGIREKLPAKQTIMRVVRKLFLTSTLALFLTTSFTLSPASAPALAASGSVGMNANLTRFHQDIDSSEGVVLINHSSKGSKNEANREKHQHGQKEKARQDKNKKFGDEKKKNLSHAESSKRNILKGKK